MSKITCKKCNRELRETFGRPEDLADDIIWWECLECDLRIEVKDNDAATKNYVGGWVFNESHIKERITDKDIKWLKAINNHYPRDTEYCLTLMVEKLALAIKELQG